MSGSIFYGQSMALKTACSNPRFTYDFTREGLFCVLMKAQITQMKFNLLSFFRELC